jgi:predicted secreted protein
MRPNGVRAASARLAASLIAALLLLATPTLAADRANLSLIGYSADGAYFAFEEYGIHDGSGGAFSSIYVLDVAADKWMYGSPFTVDAVEDEGPTLPEVRAQALAKAHDKLSELKIDSPAEYVAMIGDGVPGNDGKSLLFSVPSCCTPGQTQDDRLLLKLSVYPVAKADPMCADTPGDPTQGFALTVAGAKEVFELHRDDEAGAIPRSRGCVEDYRIYAVVQPFWINGPRIAIISSYPWGFEGPDRRFIAVPIDRKWP